MSERIKEVTYISCDGCGYVIGAKTEPYLILTMMDPGKPSTDIHFHMPERTSEGRRWGTRDCLHYWITSRVAHGYSQGWDGRGSPEGQYTRDVMKDAPEAIQEGLGKKT